MSSGKAGAQFGLDLMNLLFGKDWAEEQRLQGDKEGDLTMGALFMVSVLIWLMYVVSLIIDYKTDTLLTCSIVFGYPAILAFAAIRTRRQVRKRKEARERAKREAADHNDSQPPM